MKGFKIAAIVLAAAAILLSDIMCAVVAYNYCWMQFAGEYKGFSAPADTALLLAIPFLAGIIVCVVLAIVFYKKSRRPAQQ